MTSTKQVNQIPIPENPGRRAMSKKIALLPLITGFAATTHSSSVFADNATRVHRFEQSVPFPVNAFIIEGKQGLVVIDSTLTNTSSKALKQKIDSLNKPLKGLLLTHLHPDHYAGIHNLIGDSDIPIFSVEGVNTVVRRDDAAKNELIGGMFKDEWPSVRRFPNEIVKEGDTIDLGEGLKFDVMDIGPAESLHDSVFLLQGDDSKAFVGDLAYSMMHAYMADNQNAPWQKALDRLRSELHENTLVFVGHGQPVTPSFLQWQSEYLSSFENALKTVNWSEISAATDVVTERMKMHLPSDDLLFLMQLSIEPNARRLGLTQ